MKQIKITNKPTRIRQTLFALMLVPFLTFSSCDVLTGILNDYGTGSGGLTNAEITQGLKEALKEGARFASNKASQQNGFLDNPIVDIRILLPPELRKAEKNIRRVPIIGDNLVDDLIEAMNRGAEAAAKEAAPIFVNAITSMTVTDAVNILKGQDNAATQYLRRTTSQQLTGAFEPEIKKALNNVGATKIYNNLKNGIDKYNRTPLVNKLDVDINDLPEIEEYATEKALDGLFSLVAVEEKKIRDNPLDYSQQIIRKVFSSVQNNQSSSSNRY
ncbi:DUF4197 domain-containing protein [Catalinimonas niigatensis]|uniref:DUF4197 domain-containing protein n=1 Tax=Catalinimonas niigatensis TaxID=1397264 RepID=UPI002665D2F7|nr:DUF4197 domain-containing protein [Catalinimonas niigatensis]WPP51309.1 DUF4197 domain-containing protein [Catalinimonas niigatensis]